MDRIDELLNRVESLTPAPQALPQLLSALADTDNDVSRVVDLITFDPALTAALLWTCNSAFFGRSTPANDVSEAVRQLGFQTVCQIVAAVCVAPCLGSGTSSREPWRHSVTAAVAVHFVAEDIGADDSLLFTAGLLHDVGKIVLAEVFKEDYSRLVAETSPATGTLVEREKASYGVDHAEVGARLLERWNFSPLFVASVRFHHDPSSGGEADRLAACICLADALAHNLDEQKGQAIEWPEPNAALGILGLALDDLARYRERFKEYLGFVEAMCCLRG